MKEEVIIQKKLQAISFIPVPNNTSRHEQFRITWPPSCCLPPIREVYWSQPYG